MDIYIGGIIASLLGFFTLNIVMTNKFDTDDYSWEFGDYLIFGICMLGCIFWPITVPYSIKKLVQHL